MISIQLIGLPQLGHLTQRYHSLKAMLSSSFARHLGGDVKIGRKKNKLRHQASAWIRHI